MNFLLLMDLYGPFFDPFAHFVCYCGKDGPGKDGPCKYGSGKDGPKC
jgi:hypothetical protein